MKTAYYNLLHDVLRGYDRCTPSKIVSLRNNQIFVFGTNKYGSQKCFSLVMNYKKEFLLDL